MIVIDLVNTYIVFISTAYSKRIIQISLKQKIGKIDLKYDGLRLV